MTNRPAGAPPMSGADIDTEIAAICKQFGFRAYHTHDSRHSPEGFPDWVILGPGACLIREVKGEHRAGKGRIVRDQLTEAQAGWLEGFRAIGYNAKVWSADDWRSLTIIAEIDALRFERDRITRPHTGR